MPDPRSDLNSQCNRCLSSLIEISNKINHILASEPKADMKIYEQQLDYLEMALYRLNADLALHKADDIPY